MLWDKMNFSRTNDGWRANVAAMTRNSGQRCNAHRGATSVRIAVRARGTATCRAWRRVNAITVSLVQGVTVPRLHTLGYTLSFLHGFATTACRDGSKVDSAPSEKESRIRVQSVCAIATNHTFVYAKILRFSERTDSYAREILLERIHLIRRVILTYFVTHHEQIEWIELSRKVIYHFAVYTIVNEILITKNCQILVLNNFLLK